MSVKPRDFQPISTHAFAIFLASVFSVRSQRVFAGNRGRDEQRRRYRSRVFLVEFLSQSGEVINLEFGDAQPAPVHGAASPRQIARWARRPPNRERHPGCGELIPLLGMTPSP